MAATVFTWRDLTFTTGEDAAYRLVSVEGWEQLPPARYEKQNRTRGHGTHPSPLYAEERVVTLEGRCHSETDRDGLLRALRAAAVSYGFGDSTEPLTGVDAGLTLSAGAQVLRCDPVRGADGWGIGRFGWIVQFRCPDPLRYGIPATSSTGLPTAGGGLVYPLDYPLDYGSAGDPGQITLTNSGDAAAPVAFTVTGPLPQGFEVTTGQYGVTYPVATPDDQVLAFDTATGTVLLEGTASRRQQLTRADWFTVPPQSTITLQFTSLGGAYDPGALLTVVDFRPAYW